MSGFFEWFLVLVGVLAIFNAEKLPALRRMLEEKFKISLDVAKESSKNVKDKLDKVKSEIDTRKNAEAKPVEAEENTPEEREEALNFMKEYIKKDNNKELQEKAEVATVTENTEVNSVELTESEGENKLETETKTVEDDSFNSMKEYLNSELIQSEEDKATAEKAEDKAISLEPKD